MTKRITQKEKIRMYEGLLHDLHFASDVAMNMERTGKLLRNISRFSYAHRQGNGMLTDRQQRTLINAAFRRLRDVE